MIAHLTDIHIGEPGEKPRGVPVRDNFDSVLSDIVSAEPELLVLTGDVAYEWGNRDIYLWVRSRLEDSGLSYVILPGNHDDPRLLSEVFGRNAGAGATLAGRAHRKLNSGEEEIILLDISEGVVTGEDLQWLEKSLSATERKEVMLFMHYPPVPLPVPYMEENFSLAGREGLRSLLRDAPPHLYLFCGHYHGEMSREEPGITVFLTPSTFFQIEPQEMGFAVHHNRPAWRFLERFEGGITTGVRYCGS